MGLEGKSNETGNEVMEEGKGNLSEKLKQHGKNALNTIIFLTLGVASIYLFKNKNGSENVGGSTRMLTQNEIHANLEKDSVENITMADVRIIQEIIDSAGGNFVLSMDGGKENPNSFNETIEIGENDSVIQINNDISYIKDKDDTSKYNKQYKALIDRKTGVILYYYMKGDDGEFSVMQPTVSNEGVFKVETIGNYEMGEATHFVEEGVFQTHFTDTK